MTDEKIVPEDTMDHVYQFPMQYSTKYVQTTNPDSGYQLVNILERPVVYITKEKFKEVLQHLLQQTYREDDHKIELPNDHPIVMAHKKLRRKKSDAPSDSK